MTRQQTIDLAALPAAINLRAPTYQRFVQSGNADDTATTTTTGSATPHTLGVWVQNISASTADANLIHVRMGNTSQAATDTSSMASISIGKAAGAETEDVVMLAGFRNSNMALSDYWFPCWMPKGTRIATASRSIVASKNVPVGIDLLYAPALGRPPVPFITLGMTAASTTGTPLAGITTWVELSAACPQACAALQVTMQASSAAIGGHSENLDIGIGPAGSERVLFSLWAEANTSEYVATHFSRTGPAMVNIPKGVRIAVRGHADYEVGLILTPTWRR